MGKAVLNARIYLAQYDLSGVTNAATVNLKTDVLDATCFSDAYKDKLAGFTDVICDVSGVYSTDDYDGFMFAQQGLSNKILTIATEGGAIGTRAFFFKPLFTEYTPLDGKVSELGTFKLHGEGTGELVRGTVMVPKSAPKTLTGSSAAYQLGAVTSSQAIFCGVHLFTVSGTDTPTIKLILQSSVDEAFTIPNNRIYCFGDEAPAAPTGAMISPAAPGNVDTGDHYYKVTFVTALGETDGGTASNVVTVVNKAVNGKVVLTNIPLGNDNVTSRKIYRTEAGAGTYKLLTTIADNLTVTYTDNTADAGLGAEVPATNTSGVRGAVGQDYQSIDGAVTDTWWRTNYTITGTTPSFTMVVVAGIVTL